MPAILRNSLPNDNALIVIIRPYAFYDVVGVGRVRSATVARMERTPPSNTMSFGRF